MGVRLGVVVVGGRLGVVVAVGGLNNQMKMHNLPARNHKFVDSMGAARRGWETITCTNLLNNLRRIQTAVIKVVHMYIIHVYCSS